MKLSNTSSNKLLILLCGACLCAVASKATERSFTYTYEPETMPKGGLEYEQWVTLRAGRDAAVGQQDFNRWELRHELEYGVTDKYTLSLYVNESLENYHDPVAGSHYSHFQFDGISLENKYLVLDPLERPVGLALYLEPRYAGNQAELEQKIILGQRHGDWKWAFNLTHATEWADDFHSTEGEVETSLGLSRSLSPRWSVGIEARDHNELPDYARWENTALYIGPVVTYRREGWWAGLTVMPQVFGANFQDNPGKSSWQELEGHERWNVRLVVGFDL